MTNNNPPIQQNKIKKGMKKEKENQLMKTEICLKDIKVIFTEIICERLSYEDKDFYSRSMMTKYIGIVHLLFSCNKKITKKLNELDQRINRIKNSCDNPSVDELQKSITETERKKRLDELTNMNEIPNMDFMTDLNVPNSVDGNFVFDNSFLDSENNNLYFNSPSKKIIKPNRKMKLGLMNNKQVYNRF